jgi:hypothetical protein
VTRNVVRATVAAAWILGVGVGALVTYRRPDPPMAGPAVWDAQVDLGKCPSGIHLPPPEDGGWQRATLTIFYQGAEDPDEATAAFLVTCDRLKGWVLAQRTARP